MSSDYILESSREYSLYVCNSRAIPKVADGLKDGQRKALWLIRNRADKIKTVSLAGEMISSELYLHGDASASGTISSLAAPYLNNVPYLDGRGNFGTKVAPDAIGAPRYTYVKRGKALQNLLLTDLDIVPLKENHDGSNMEPVHFLPLIPTVLLNGVSGMAVGWSTEILPHKFEDLKQACIDYLKGKKIKPLKPYFNNYELIINNIEDSSWEITGRLEIVDSSTIRVVELPSELSLEKFKERLNKFEDERKINDYTDRSSEEIDVVIKMPRGSLKDWTEEKAIEFLKLRSRKTERIVVIDFNCQSIRQYESPEEVVRSFVEWRLEWYNNRYQKKLYDDSYELNYWKALKLCFDNNLPKEFTSFNSKQEIIDRIENICKDKVELDQDQVNKICSLPSYQWTSDNLPKYLEKINLLSNNISLYNKILGDENMRREIYIKELESLSV